MTGHVLASAAGSLFCALIGDGLRFFIDREDITHVEGSDTFIYSTFEADFDVKVISESGSAAQIASALIEIMTEQDEVSAKLEEHTQVTSEPGTDTIEISWGQEKITVLVTLAQASVNEVTESHLAHALRTESFLNPYRMTEVGDGSFEYAYGAQTFVVSNDSPAPVQYSQIILGTVTEPFAVAADVIVHANTITLRQEGKTPVVLTVTERS